MQDLEAPDRGLIKRKEKICFMFQDFQLFPHMNVLQNLTYAPNLNGDKSKNERRARILLKDLESKNHVYQTFLSRANQRIALSRSLMIDPDILLCDKPTSGVDLATTSDVVSLLKSVYETGVTIVIASHDLDSLAKYQTESWY
jgi:polar amino acid transport system ATP-binding protein